MRGSCTRASLWGTSGYVHAPLFVSTLPTARTIGITLVISLIATLVVERDALTSVWCFFAAILSLQTLGAVERVRASTPRPLVA